MILKHRYYADRQKQGHIDLNVASKNRETLVSKLS